MPHSIWVLEMPFHIMWHDVIWRSTNIGQTHEDNQVNQRQKTQMNTNIDFLFIILFLVTHVLSEVFIGLNSISRLLFYHKWMSSEWALSGKLFALVNLVILKPLIACIAMLCRSCLVRTKAGSHFLYSLDQFSTCFVWKQSVCSGFQEMASVLFVDSFKIGCLSNYVQYNIEQHSTI